MHLRLQVIVLDTEEKYYDRKMGNRIRQARILEGYTQQKLGELCDVGNQQISMIETGQSGIASSTLVKMSRALNVSTEYILFGQVARGSDPIDNLLNRLSPYQQEQAIELLRLFVEAYEHKGE